MKWRFLLAMMATLAPCQVRADIGMASAQTANLVCRQAIAAAERAHGIPPHLLAAIARVESGRKDQASNSFNPWPWTINFDGQGSFYDNKAQAVAAATSMRPRVTQSIDVGCMQISLTNHPDAFASLDQAFDPSANADYGARFLLQLFAKTGSWPKAVEFYHSATPELGHDYGQKVYAVLPEETKLAYGAEPDSIRQRMGHDAKPLAADFSPCGRSGGLFPGRPVWAGNQRRDGPLTRTGLPRSGWRFRAP